MRRSNIHFQKKNAQETHFAKGRENLKKEKKQELD
jgi:hypothetical protein